MRDPATGRSREETRYAKFDNVDVRFLGVFETVPSMGDPYSGINPGYDVRVDPKFVKHGSHAMGTDEFRRAFSPFSFKPTLDSVLPDNLTEQWFRGAHSDLGGGHAPGEEGKSNGLARDSLRWMYVMAKKAGVPLRDLVGDNSTAPVLQDLGDQEIQDKLVHDSRQGTTGFIDKWIDRQSRTIFYPEGGRETLTREEMVSRMHAQEQGKAAVIKEDDNRLILEPIEERP